VSDAAAARTHRPVRVDQPLVLISQVQRSGGTLLQRLLDGHPQLHVMPFQFRGVDGAVKRGPSEPDEAWAELYDPKLADRFRQGHRQRKRDVLRDEDVFSFELRPELHRAIYDACAAALERPDTRSLVACYLTGYFNGWVDYANLAGDKRWVVAFEPSIADGPGRWESLHELYPDGRVLSIVRDPWSWLASARRWEPRWRDREQAIAHWCGVGRRTLKWRKHVSPAFLMLTFEDLLKRTEPTMRRVAAFLEIDFLPELLVPTFNGQPIRANTSFADVSTEISTKPLERARHELSEDDERYVTEHAEPEYRRLLKVVEKDRLLVSG
jgi:Sulfotransferase family